MYFKSILSVNMISMGAIILSSCATTPNGPIRDRYGLMSVELPVDWEDVTSDYLDELEAAMSFGKLRNDTGIRQLLFLERSGYADCKFRELTYMPGEVGYNWKLEKLNYEVAQARNQAMKYSAAELVRLGLIPQLPNTIPNSSVLTLSSAPTFTRFQAWQHRYRHEFNGNLTGKVYADTWTISMQFISKSDPAKRYLVAECSLEASNSKNQGAVTDVERLLASVNFDGDISLRPTQ